MLRAHALHAGHHGLHADAYVKGALHERAGQHHALKKTGLVHAASAHGYSGTHAEAYAAGAMCEAQGLHDAGGE